MVMWIVFSRQVQLRPLQGPCLALCWKVTVEGARLFLIAVILMFLVQTL